MMNRDTTKEPFWAFGVEDTYRALSTSPSGLSEEEARARARFFGPNDIRDERHFVRLKIFFSQFRSPLILILVGAGLITLFLEEWLDAIVIFGAVFINAGLGFYQENKAESALALLKSYIRIKSRVRRSGGEHEVDAATLVPGDVIHLSQGNRVPADARLIFSNGLEADESILTGESLPVEKSPAALLIRTTLPNRTSMVFSGTLVVRGLGEALVTATGSETEFGKIARLVSREPRTQTPLQREILRFTKIYGAIFAALVVILFAFGLYEGRNFLDMFLVAVAVAVSAVPEGLPIAFTVVLAIGVEHLARKKTIVRKLIAAETLGATTLILTDKTGTLTQATMALTGVVPYGGGSGAEKERELLEASLQNVDVVIENPSDVPVEWRVFGQALEVALVKGAAMRGVLMPRVLEKANVCERMPFSPEHRFSASLSEKSGTPHIVIFGAPEAILPHTNFSDDDAAALKEEVGRHAASGEKVLGIASGEYVKTKDGSLSALGFRKISFRGLILFRDPPRPRVGEVIRHIHAQGVRTIIVTGDHLGTAQAVAREVNISREGAIALEGDDLRHLSPEELAARADAVSVYARVTPEQKVTITHLYQKRGEVVAVVGDGVNDAPALEAADIGVAVGSGTDVAKSAADLVMLEDDFEILVTAIDEGRRIFDNMRKVVVYLLSDSLDELLLIGGSLLFGLAMPLNALQILFVNFFSDSFPAVALAFEKNADGALQRPQRRTGLLDKEMRFLIFIIGAVLSFLLLFLYIFLLARGFSAEHVRTFIFGSFSLGTLFLIFSVRSLERSIFEYNPFSNKYINIGVLIGALLTLAAIYLPFFQRIFDTVPLSPLWFLGIFGVGLINIFAVEFGKWLFRFLRRINVHVE